MDFIHNSADTGSNLSQEALCLLPHKLLRGSIKPGWYSGCESESHLVMSDSLRPHGLYSPWNLLGQNTGVGSLSLLQWIFPAQESNQGLPHCRQILYHLSHQERPGILEWVAYPFSSGSSWPRNRTRVSFIAGRFFTSWATREAPKPEWWHGNEKKETIWGVEKILYSQICLNKSG